MPVTPTAKPILLLLEPEFQDPAIDDRRFFCRHSFLLEGALTQLPGLREQLDVRHIGFQRPRDAVIDFVGETDQSLPKLVLPADVQSQHASGHHAARQYVSGAERILATLGELYGIAQPHP